MIKVVDVSHHYGVKPVLSHVSLEMPPGQLVVLMGPNGVGKSTLLSIIAGVMAPAAGYVEINGLRRRATEQAELEIRRQLAFLPDQPWLPEFKTGREWLMAVGQLYDLDPERLMDHISRLLRLFHLADKGESPIRTYSNGQKKKLAICGVLVTETPILILDEPFTGGLDAAAILALGRVLKHLADQKDKTVIMASQIGEMVEPLAHRIAILEGARLKAYDTLAALRERPAAPVRSLKFTKNLSVLRQSKKSKIISTGPRLETEDSIALERRLARVRNADRIRRGLSFARGGDLDHRARLGKYHSASCRDA